MSKLPETENSTPFLEMYLEHVDGSLIELSKGMGFFGIPLYRIRVLKEGKISVNDVYYLESARDYHLSTILKRDKLE